MDKMRRHDQQWLGMTEAVQLSGYSFNWMRQLIASGKVEAVKRRQRGARWAWAISRKALVGYMTEMGGHQ